MNREENGIMDNKIKLNFLAGVQVENLIYFSAWNMNGFFKYDIQKEKCTFLKSFPGEKDSGLHSEAILYHDSIWFIPRASERIAIVNLKNLDITYIELPEFGYHRAGNIIPIRMRGYYKSGGNFLCVIPYDYKMFLKIDMEKKKIIREERWGENENVVCLGVMIQDELWIYKNISNEILVINMLSDELKIKKIEKRSDCYVGIQSVGEWILLFPIYLKDGILLLNTKNNITKVVDLEDNEQWYYEYQVLIKENNLLLVPYEGSNRIQIHIDNNGNLVKKDTKLIVDENAYCSTKLICNDEVWFLSHVTSRPIFCFNLRSENIYYRHIYIELEKFNEDILKCLTMYGVEYSPLANVEVIYERYYLLKYFLQYIKNDILKKTDLLHKQVGNDIYEWIK